MIDLNEIRKMFAEELARTSNNRFSFDTALFKVCEVVYRQGLEEGYNNKVREE